MYFFHNRDYIFILLSKRVVEIRSVTIVSLGREKCYMIHKEETVIQQTNGTKTYDLSQNVPWRIPKILKSLNVGCDISKFVLSDYFVRPPS